MATPLRIRFARNATRWPLRTSSQGWRPRSAGTVIRGKSRSTTFRPKTSSSCTLEAVRHTLSGQPSATAEVVVNGDTYQMRAE